jgi:hypothetical protein
MRLSDVFPQSVFVELFFLFLGVILLFILAVRVEPGFSRCFPRVAVGCAWVTAEVRVPRSNFNLIFPFLILLIVLGRYTSDESDAEVGLVKCNLTDFFF